MEAELWAASGGGGANDDSSMDHVTNQQTCQSTLEMFRCFTVLGEDDPSDQLTD